MKSHFRFTKGQRNGIFLLLLIIITLQGVYFFVEIPDRNVASDEAMLNEFRKEIDSLRLIKLKVQQPKIYPFNPNYITDYKGYTLGMSNEEIDRLLNFRKQDQWVNSAKQFLNNT